MSTAFHPQTDGQTERINQVIEHYIHTYCNYEQSNWYEMLAMAEYAYNNSITTATDYSPFYSNYGFHPKTTWPTDYEAKNPASRQYVHWMTGVHTVCRQNLKESRERMGKYYDKHAKEPPMYKIGDLVMLNGKNLKTRRPSRKLDQKLHGPFAIIKVITRNAVRLALPSRWRVHNTFHVSMVEPFRVSKKGLRPEPDLADVLAKANDLDNKDVFAIEEVMGSSWDKRRKKVLYLVMWEGYPDREDWTEEPYENFMKGGLGALRKFHKENPAAVKDSRLVLGGKKAKS
jgi:hypothetical protein